MPVEFLDPYSGGQTVCHRLPPRLKLVLTLLVIAIALVVPIEHWPLHVCLALVVFIGLSLAEIPVHYIARRLALFAPMVLCIALSVPASTGFVRGWELAATVGMRAVLSFLAGLWLVNTTRFEQILVAAGRLGFPALLVALLAFMYRYCYVLMDELGRMRTAQRARTFGRRSRWQEWRESTLLIGSLLIRAMNRAERIHGAMCARGFQGKMRPLD